MESAKESKASGSQIVIQLDQRLFFGVIAVIGIVAIFLVGLMLGKLTASPAAQPQVAAFPQQQVPLVQQQPGQPLQVQPLQPGQQVPSFTQGRDPNLLKPAGDDVAIGNNPRLALPELAEIDYNWDFGDIGPEEAVEKVFTVRNTGTEELVIDRVTSSCGCTAALMSDTRIPAGGEGELRVSYDPRVNKDRGEAVTRYVDVLSNDPAAPQVRFTVTAYVREQ